MNVRRLEAVTEAQCEQLAQVLIDCVEGNASVSFMHPLALPKALAFWRKVGDGVAAGERALLVVEDSQGLAELGPFVPSKPTQVGSEPRELTIVGTVQLMLAQPENQPHRADLAKMLVHRRARRCGAGAALLQAAERVAIECGKTLLVLDTASADAERLYERCGWQPCGVIPDFALLPRGGYCDTRLFYRRLRP